MDGDEVKELVIPNSVTSIGGYAFSDCSGLSSVTIPNSVTSIGSHAFSDCSGLSSVTIPNSVTSIGWYAFSGCSGLTSVTIGNGVTSIGKFAFSGCLFDKENFINNSSLSAEENEYWGAMLYDYETEDGLLIDGTCVVLCRENAEIATIPNGVTSIGDYAFRNCSVLTSVTIPNGVTSIGIKAFEYCSALTSVTIPNSVTSIGEYAFSGCHFAKGNFVNNSALYPEEHKYWGAKLYDYETQDGLFIRYSVVVKCRENSDKVIIPDSVTSIGDDAFRGCDGLTSVTIPNSVTSIGNSAFSGCSGLTSVTIPNSVTSIGDYAFRNCSGLTSVTIPNSVTSIGGSAFSGCSGLTSVTIPNSVTSIGYWAFYGCMLQTIVCNAMNPATISGGSEDRVVCGTNMYNHTQLYVPEGAYWDYAFSDWGNFIRIKEMAMDTEDLESRKAYMIADATGRNFSVYDSAKGCLVNIAYTHALDEESDGSCWTVLKDGAASYLYNIGAKKYGTVSEDGVLTLSDTPMVIDIVNTEDGLSINGKPCMFVLNKNISFDATGIDDLKGENGSVKTAVYDLSGRRVHNAQKGVYIQNGKVVMVR